MEYSHKRQKSKAQPNLSAAALGYEKGGEIDLGNTKREKVIGGYKAIGDGE